MPQRAFSGTDRSFGSLIVPFDAACRAFAWRIMDGLEIVERSDVTFESLEAALAAAQPAFARWIATRIRAAASQA